MVLLRKRTQIAIAQEAVAGTPEALAAGDAMLITDQPTWDPDVQVTERQALSASLSPRGSVIGTRAAKISWKQYLRGLSAEITDPGNLPEYNVPFRGCGLDVTVSGVAPADQASYVPTTSLVVDATNGSYCTVGMYEDGKRYQIHGAVGNCTLTFTTGVPVLAEFEFTGVYNAPTDTALLSPTYPTIIEPPFLSAALSVIGFATARIQSMTLNFGNEIAMRPSPNDAEGFFTAQIVGRKPTGTLDPEEELAATKNWFNEWISGTLGAITTGVFPSTGDNRNQMQLTIPNAAYTKVSRADREGIGTAPIDFECRANSDAGDDEFEFIQT
jgi:hypothetical protein